MFWQPDSDARNGDLYLVAATASDQRLYLILEGPGISPPPFKGAPTHYPELLAVRIFTPSGGEVTCGMIGGNMGKAGSRPRTYFVDAPLPPDSSEPLTVQIVGEDGSIMWEGEASPVG